METFLCLIKELCLPIGIVALLFHYYWSDKSAKDCFSISKYFIIISIALEVWGYDKELFPQFFKTDIYNLTFLLATSLAFYVWLLLSIKWFTTENLPSCRFCVQALLLLFCYNKLITSNNIAITAIALLLIIILQYMLLRFSQDNEEFHNISGRYAASIGVFVILIGAAVWILYPQHLEYTQVSQILVNLSAPEKLIIASGLVLVFMFMLGVAPLHFWLSDTIGPSILPVSAYFGFVPLAAIWGMFIKINTILLPDLLPQLEKVYILCAIVSLVIGAIGVNTTRNLRKIFSSSSIYNAGIILLIFSPFNTQAVTNGTFYLLIYIIGITGIYGLFYGLKSNGEYLSNLNTMHGFFKSRPLLALILFVLSCSLMMIVPFPGFLSLWNLLTSNMAENKVLLSCIVMLCTVVLIPAFMHVCRAIFFTDKSTNFDRVDYSVYEVVLLSVGILIFIMLYPNKVYDGINAVLFYGE